MTPTIPSYKITRKLETGSSSLLFVISSSHHHLPLCIKIFPKSSVPPANWCKNSIYGKIPLEAEILRMANHKNIIGFVDYYGSVDTCYLVMEMHAGYVARCTLPISDGCLKDEKNFWMCKDKRDLFEFRVFYGVVGFEIVKKIMLQVVDAVSYLHKNDINHGDIKEENILINSNLEIKLVDFGSSQIFTSNTKPQTKFYGTIFYAPPEVIKGERWDIKQIDIWALGILLYVLLHGNRPFLSNKDILKCRPIYNSSIPVECRILLSKMLEVDRNKRASIEDVENEMLY